MVYAHANIRSGSSICSVSIEWGNGGASVAGEYRGDQAAARAPGREHGEASGRLIASDGSPAGASDAADVSAFVAEGTDGETLREHRMAPPDGSAAGTLARARNGSCASRATTPALRRSCTSSTGPPELGVEPTILIPAPAGRRFRARRFDSQGFVDSVQWGASSTALTYTPNPAANVRVDAELLL